MTERFSRLDREKGETIQAVLFDFGSVLYQTPRARWLPYLLRLMRLLRPKKFRENGILLMMQHSPATSPQVMDLMTGKAAEKIAWEEFSRSWGIPPVWFERMRRIAFSPKRLNMRLLDYCSRMRPGYKVALLTNAGTEFRETFVKEFRLEKFFDRVIISAEEELAKPDPKIYLRAAEILGILPAQAVFFDDLEENLLGAKKAGMQAYQFQNNQQVLDILKSLPNRN